MKHETGTTTTGAIIGLIFVIWAFASWLTHVVVCISDDRWGFLIAGAIFAPVGMIHGTGVWLGVW